jgi:uncharacterized protein YjbI with pentapeptide repeats
MKYTKEELTEICKKHIKWLRDEEGGNRADLRRANLQGADLQGADLRGADLQGANLQGADLQGADLRGADLPGADLRRANLQGANLQGADLRRANLQGADLRGADLRGADLDFSCFPLWCGGSRFKAESKIVLQILAHTATIDITDADSELTAVMESVKIIAKRSHRAADLGLH